MAIIWTSLFVLTCAVVVLSLPVEKRQIDPVDALCASSIAQNASLSYTVEIASDCTKFAQCLPDGGYVVGACAAGTFFDPIVLRCQYSNIASCATNPCSGQRDGAMIADPRGCATFFGCSGGIAIPLTCPEGQSFQAGSCVPDANCAFIEQTTIAMSPAELCFAKGLRPYPGDNTMYLSLHAGGVEIEMPCAPGTVLDDACSCIFAG